MYVKQKYSFFFKLIFFFLTYRQFHYNEDFVYDMALQVESDKNDDLQEIVPSGRHHKHR